MDSISYRLLTSTILAQFVLVAIGFSDLILPTERFSILWNLTPINMSLVVSVDMTISWYTTTG